MSPTLAGAPACALTEVTFATFWAGRRISGYEARGKASFVRHGYHLLGHSYDTIENLPEDVERADAAAIAAPGNQQRFLIRGGPPLANPGAGRAGARQPSRRAGAAATTAAPLPARAGREADYPPEVGRSAARTD